ncbi:MAG TPA: hypothetical protein EYN66_09990 [Myxococcales bacterium]|nr:hypothetical protein [Myxococcales bacterium]
MHHLFFTTPMLIIALGTGCGGDEPAPPGPSSVRKVAAPVKKSAGYGPGEVKEFVSADKPTLIMSQSQSVKRNGKMIPGPAKMVLWQQNDSGWSYHIVEDPMSNVFHKAMPWGDNQLITIAGDKAAVRTWSLSEGKWSRKSRQLSSS